MKEQKHYVYWVHEDFHTDPKTEGYVGVSVDPKRRLSNHRYEGTSEECANYLLRCDDARTKPNQPIIAEFDDRAAALAFEKELRPERGVGWNHAAGGWGGAFLGRHHTEETKQILREASTGRVATEASKKKVADKLRGIPQKPSTVAKMKIAKEGKNNPMFGVTSPMKGKHHTEETKAKMSVAIKAGKAKRKARLLAEAQV